MIEGEERPGVAVGRVVLADGAPLPPGDCYGPPQRRQGSSAVRDSARRACSTLGAVFRPNGLSVTPHTLPARSRSRAASRLDASDEVGLEVGSAGAGAPGRAAGGPVPVLGASTSPSRCTRLTRSPRSYGHRTSTSTPGRGSSSATSSRARPARRRCAPRRRGCAARAAQPGEHLGVGEVGLVDDDDLAQVAGADLAEHLADGGELALRVGVRAVDDVQQEVGVADLLQRRAERLDQLVRQATGRSRPCRSACRAGRRRSGPGARSGPASRTARPRPGRPRR